MAAPAVLVVMGPRHRTSCCASWLLQTQPEFRPAPHRCAASIALVTGDSSQSGLARAPDPCRSDHHHLGLTAETTGRPKENRQSRPGRLRSGHFRSHDSGTRFQDPIPARPKPPRCRKPPFGMLTGAPPAAARIGPPARPPCANCSRRYEPAQFRGPAPAHRTLREPICLPPPQNPWRSAWRHIAPPTNAVQNDASQVLK